MSKLTYLEACAAMQAAVGVVQNLNINNEWTPKHLRVGVNSAMSDQGAIAQLLIAKGVFTEDEYAEAIAEGMRREVASYEKVLSKHFGKKVTLGCDQTTGRGVVSIEGEGVRSES